MVSEGESEKLVVDIEDGIEETEVDEDCIDEEGGEEEEEDLSCCDVAMQFGGTIRRNSTADVHRDMLWR